MAMAMTVPFAVSLPLPVPLVASVVPIVEEKEGRRRPFFPPEEILDCAHVYEESRFRILGAAGRARVAGERRTTHLAVVRRQIVKFIDRPSGTGL